MVVVWLCEVQRSVYVQISKHLLYFISVDRGDIENTREKVGPR